MSYRPILIVAIATLLSACASDPTRGKTKALDDAVRGYAATIRWGDIEQAEAFIDPEFRTAHPLGSIERSRYRQIRVSGYTEQGVQRISDNELQQAVTIELINENTQGVRSIMDRQTWRFDEKAQRWWLVTGLPDIAPRE
ncbi:MAG: hypothetical protein ABIR16_00790 [Dokdonella sp.]